MSELRTTGDPIAVQYDTVTSALEFLGIFDHDDITNVLIWPKRIVVERLRRDENGQLVAAGNTAATMTHVIAVQKDES